MLENWLIAARGLQYTSLLLLCGVPCFVLYALSPEQARQLFWRRLTLTLSLLGWLSMLLWLMAQSALLAERPSDALHWQALSSMIEETRFGQLQASRIVWLTLASIALLFAPRTRRTWRLQALSGSVLLISLAWSGHGHIDQGSLGAVHLAADAAHLLAAAVWLGALAGLLLLLRRASADASQRLRALEHFSAIGTAVVVILILSGIINSVLLIGTGHWRALPGSSWGRTLLSKLLLFVLMLLLAALNRFHLSPRLRSSGDAATWRTLRASVMLETLLGLLVVSAVALLGTLPPPVSD